MRIDATSISSLLQSAQSLSSRQVSISQQLSSGVRISALSDDATAVGRSAQLSSTLSQGDAFLKSATTTASRLQAGDAALSSVVTQLTQAVTLAVQGANDTQSSSSRNAIALNLIGIQDSVRSLANSTYQNTYLFAGSKSTSAPFVVAADGSTTYAGDTQTSTLRLGNGDQIQVALSGSAIFSDPTSPVFTALQAVISSLQNGAAPSITEVSNLRNSLTNVIAQRSVLGSQASRLDTEKTYANTQQSNVEAEQTKLLASDPVSLATELSASETQQTALLKSIAISQKGSLFDYI